jgi:hypothetical protein
MKNWQECSGKATSAGRYLAPRSQRLSDADDLAGPAGPLGGCGGPAGGPHNPAGGPAGPPGDPAACVPVSCSWLRAPCGASWRSWWASSGGSGGAGCGRVPGGPGGGRPGQGAAKRRRVCRKMCRFFRNALYFGAFRWVFESVYDYAGAGRRWPMPLGPGPAASRQDGDGQAPPLPPLPRPSTHR